MDLPNAVYTEDHQRVSFFARALEDISALPGVTSSGAISFLPLTGPAAATRFVAVDKPAPNRGDEPTTEVRVLSGDYFQTMGIPLQRGRTFDSSDARPESRTIVINDTLARTIWPGEDPIGKQLRVNWGDPPATDTVVGVVGDVRHDGAEGEVRPTIYWPHARVGYRGLTIVTRTEGDPVQVASMLARAIRARDRDLPAPVVESMERVVSASVRERRLIMTVLGVFAGLALVLAAVGIYSVMAYTVGQRTHEIGVRMAIGASGRDVMRLVLGQALSLAGLGLAAGAAAALAMTRLMRALLFGVEPTDLVTLGAVMVVLLAVALLAGFVPSRRASRVDPLVALRYE